MTDTSDFYFKSYEQWHHAITTHCNIELTPDYARSRVSALKDSSNKSTKEFTSKYGEAYLNQVIEWFERAEQSS